LQAARREETGNWRFETGNWKLEIQNYKLDTQLASFEFPVSNFDFPLRQRTTDQGQLTALEELLMLKAGDQAPAFSLPADSRGKISLDAFKGKTLVLFFFPKADTPG
jgi:hypothetical protein